MDTLTLLCNHFAEGPTLLARLHAAGCRDCAGIERFDVDELVGLLGATRELALQLQFEARALSDDARRTRRATGLRPESVRGLEIEHCMQLRRLGVDSIEDLVEAGALELARALDIGVDRVVRWQACARRALEATPEGPAQREVTLTPRAGALHVVARQADRFSPNETRFVPRPTGLERDLASFEPRRRANPSVPRT